MFPEDRFVEILIIGALALIVIGPKDLPILMRRLGRFIGKMRAMAAEFRASYDELARQSELDELRKEVEALRHSQTGVGVPQPMSAAPTSAAYDTVDPVLAATPEPGAAEPKAMGE